MFTTQALMSVVSQLPQLQKDILVDKVIIAFKVDDGLQDVLAVNCDEMGFRDHRVSLDLSPLQVRVEKFIPRYPDEVRPSDDGRYELQVVIPFESIVFIASLTCCYGEGDQMDIRWFWDSKQKFCRFPNPPAQPTSQPAA